MYAFPTSYELVVGVFSVRTSDVGRATSKLSDSRRIWTFRAPLFQPDKKKRGGVFSFSCRIFVLTNPSLLALDVRVYSMNPSTSIVDIMHDATISPTLLAYIR